ncbi:MAG: integrase arm-type DNA-binding domain-containing protein [Pseudomonadota bacterium]|nr:integrase arm-type DNA-binding domain-containing protein [Pseudomonadota bacterium]
MALTDIAIRKLQHSGKPAGDKHADGLGMYLRVKAAGKYWRMDYRFEGKHKTLALGVYPEVSLAAARATRAEARALLATGVDPAALKQEAKRALAPEAKYTFRAVAEEFAAKDAKTLKPKTIQKHRGWLDNDILPLIGDTAIADLRPRDVLAVAQRAESRGSIETSHRVLQYCSRICRYAIAATLVEVDVTSGLRGALEKPVTKHYAAITEPAELGKLLRKIDKYEGSYSVVGALRLAPLVFVRPGELRGAEWDEFDLDGAEWRIPAARMKMDSDHIVPLARQAVEVLRWIQPLSGVSKYVFPSIRSIKSPLSDGAVNAALRLMGYEQEIATGHGFRATARTIMDEVLCERVDLIEHQLAHKVKDVHGRAYNRTAHLPARRDMMQRWADYLESLRATPSSPNHDAQR